MASTGTAASKRQERFHGAFTGGFSAGFYNSVRMKSVVSVSSALSSARLVSSLCFVSPWLSYLYCCAPSPSHEYRCARTQQSVQ